MKRYKPYKARKLKLPRRLVFFGIIALIIFIFAIILGNVLKSHLENADIDKTPIEIDTTSNTEEDNTPSTLGVPHDNAMLYVNAGFFAPSSEKDEDGNIEFGYAAEIDAIAASGKNAISFIVNDENGKLTYASEAMQEHSMLPASNELVPVSVISEAVYYANSKGLRSTAVIRYGEIEPSLIIAKELKALGFADICVEGIPGASFETNEANTLITFFKAIREGAEISVGAAFDKEFFLNSKNTATFEKFFAELDYLAIDLRSVPTEDIRSVADSIKGSFTYYLIRPLLTSDSVEYVSECDKILSEYGIGARQYVSALPEVNTDNDDN